ncbi:helix-turn-helix domain-containing protein [Mycolicibacterium poriferae]|uniref:helix-turn-helix domain-containing protein n=1 Tax=Mycolicibacterium poriferae TaxID=39694 RepID=UPI0024BAED7A|nr:helix-turn-helix transcriptional regulator [Mycolicibacterium poriferae]
MSNTGKLDSQWNLRELMAQHGMYQTTQLRPKLQERGIELSDSQVHRLVVETPERINIKMLLALMDILGCGMEELIQPVKLGKSSARAVGERQGPDPGVGSHRPKRARITTNEQ